MTFPGTPSTTAIVNTTQSSSSIDTTTTVSSNKPQTGGNIGDVSLAISDKPTMTKQMSQSSNEDTNAGAESGSEDFTIPTTTSVSAVVVTSQAGSVASNILGDDSKVDPDESLKIVSVFIVFIAQTLTYYFCH